MLLLHRSRRALTEAIADRDNAIAHCDASAAGSHTKVMLSAGGSAASRPLSLGVMSAMNPGYIKELG
jgi:hypothetical protein